MMKNILEKTTILFLLIALYSCAGGKEMNFEQNPPFEVASSYTQKWIAGVKEGGAGTHIHIEVKEVKEAIFIKNVYFEDRVAALKQKPNQPDWYFANITNNENRDIVMSGDSLEEAVNLPPEKIPFTLEENELIIEYLIDGDTKFYRIIDVEEKPMLAYPASNSTIDQ